MIEDIDKKQNNPINNSSADQRNMIKSSGKENDKNDSVNQNVNINNPQLGENFDNVNKDHRINLSSNQNFASNQYNSNSHFMGANN